MERASKRQVHYAARMLGQYARRGRQWELPNYMRKYVVTNGSSKTHTISTSKLADLSKEEMDRLLRDLKG